MNEPRITFQDVPKGWYELMRNIEAHLKNSGIAPDLLFLIKVRSSQINGCGYCTDMHYKDALKAGEKLQRLYLLSAWRESPVYSDAEKAALNLTDVLTLIADARPDTIERAYDEVAAYYNKAEIAHLVMAINQINSWNRIAITFGTVPGTYQS